MNKTKRDKGQIIGKFVPNDIKSGFWINVGLTIDNSDGAVNSDNVDCLLCPTSPSERFELSINSN